MVTHETTHYEDFTIKTFTEHTDGVVTTYEEYDTKGRKVYSMNGNFTEKWEYSRNRLRRYSNSRGDWKRYTYNGDKIFVLECDNGFKTIVKSEMVNKDDEFEPRPIIYSTPKRRKWKQTTIQF